MLWAQNSCLDDDDREEHSVSQNDFYSIWMQRDVVSSFFGKKFDQCVYHKFAPGVGVEVKGGRSDLLFQQVVQLWPHHFEAFGHGVRFGLELDPTVLQT